MRLRMYIVLVAAESIEHHISPLLLQVASQCPYGVLKSGGLGLGRAGVLSVDPSTPGSPEIEASPGEC